MLEKVPDETTIPSSATGWSAADWRTSCIRDHLAERGVLLKKPELWISSVFFWNAPNGVWHDDFADFDLWLRQNIGSQT